MTPPPAAPSMERTSSKARRSAWIFLSILKAGERVSTFDVKAMFTLCHLQGTSNCSRERQESQIRGRSRQDYTGWRR